MHSVMNGLGRLKTDRLDVEYFSSTEGEHPVLFLHGNFATCRWWKPVFERLHPKYLAVAPTMRGCRGTPGGTGPYTVEGLAEDVETFVTALGMRRFHLVGHSLGGAIALEYAMRFPERVSGLDLVAPAPDDSLASILDNDTHSSRMLKALNLDRIMDRTAVLTMLRLGRDFGTNRRYLRRVLTALMPGVDTTKVDFEELLNDAAAMEPLAIVGLYQALKVWDAGERVASIKVPTRVMAGARDGLVPLGALKELAGRIPSARLTVLPTNGHSPMLESPDAFTSWLEEGLTTAPVGLMAAPSVQWTLAKARPALSWVGWLASTVRRWFARLMGKPPATSVGDGKGQ